MVAYRADRAWTEIKECCWPNDQDNIEKRILKDFPVKWAK